LCLSCSLMWDILVFLCLVFCIAFLQMLFILSTLHLFSCPMWMIRQSYLCILGMILYIWGFLVVVRTYDDAIQLHMIGVMMVVHIGTCLHWWVHFPWIAQVKVTHFLLLCTLVFVLEKTLADIVYKLRFIARRESIRA
jgi:hypothetical protein